MTQQLANPLEELVEMLTYARPHGSPTEAAFVQRFIEPLNVTYDKFGNAYKQIGRAPILWSCHTDTVHHKHGIQQVRVKKGIVSLVSGQRGDCLGADDGAGVWLMCEMIRAAVPGLYIFHAGEEHGCLGSQHIATREPENLSGLLAAIAFDRKGTRDIITHQMGERSCSDTFALSLAAALALQYRPDDTGTYTDTAQYTRLIGECTNVSVGYEGAHGHGETLDLRHIQKLRNRLVKFDPSCLVFERQPGDPDPDLAPNNEPLWYNGPSGDYDEAILELVRDYPEAAARLLRDMGLNADDMLQAIAEEGYDVP